jgi:hypothetical protein
VGAAVRMTREPPGKLPLHGFPDVAAQLSPAGLLLTMPVPVPLRITLSATVGGAC